MPTWKSVFNAATVLYLITVVAWFFVTWHGINLGKITIDKLSDRLWELVLLFQGLVILLIREARSKQDAS